MCSELLIKTSNKDFIDSLRREKIPDLKISERVSRLDSAYSIIDASTIISVVITSVSSVSLSMFSSWLYDYFKNKNSDETTINNTNIINNPEKVTLIINNYIQNIETDKSQSENG